MGDLTFSSLLVGSGHPTHGLHRVAFNATTGAFGFAGSVLDQPDVTWFTPAGADGFCYAVSEGPAQVLTLELDRAATGPAAIRRHEAAAGEAPCHIVVEPRRRTAIVAHYNGGGIAAYPVLADGQLGPCSAYFPHAGHGADPERQASPHPHSTTLSADGRFAYVCDLGLDQVLTYRLGDAPGELQAPAVPPAITPAGSGPRHAKLSADGRFLYVVNEMGGSVTTFAITPATGALTNLGTLSALPADFEDYNDSSEIQFHPAVGQPFVYVANRGPDTLSRFARDPATGALRLLGHTSTDGYHPRHFTLSPDGRWLIVANRHSHDLRSFAVDPRTGDLTPTGHRAELSEPCCVRFER